MSRLGTILSAALIATALAAPVHATEGIYGDPVDFFATCTGRLSAQMEFQWLMSDADADRTKAQRAAMIDILQAMTPPEQGREVLHTRISAKHAHWALLQQAQFATDPEEAAHAERVALRLMQGCTAFLLS